jgi:glycogen phosphorylase
MPTFRRYTVQPSIPARLSKLRELAYNLWWSWRAEGHELFVRLDRDLWEEVYGNPIELMSRLGQARLAELAADDAFLQQLDRAHAALTSYLQEPGWFRRTYPQLAGKTIGYFSMEFGLHESLPIYSGGLGVLAGDHLKSASDLGLPLVGIGLAYAEGYFRQVLSKDDWQQEQYPKNDWHRLPVEPVFEQDAQGKHTANRLIIHVQYPHGMVHAQLWRVQVGRTPLYLLDTNIEANAESDRGITGPLYGGDQEFRVRQEIMLGIGGIHALEALGITPSVCHMNEGHSAFLSLERIRRAMVLHKVPFNVASQACAPGNVFTTHTPVPAGNDRFAADLIKRYFEPYRETLGLSREDFLALGQEDASTRPAPAASKTAEVDAPFSMPHLAIRQSEHRNGVSALHGVVSRAMYNPMWPDLPKHEVPIASVTNGVHIATWLSDDFSALYRRYLGEDWDKRLSETALWSRIAEIPDAELWAAHVHRKQRLVALCRKRSHASLAKRGASETDLRLAQTALNPDALTIGFARRFATYKRAALLLTDVPRLMRLLGDSERPVQFVFAGKAHPQDKGGKELIREISRASREAGLQGKVVFIENYDMRVARALVSGVDVWLNNPRRPLEASGTSGMKAAANGVLNLSILDGWWAEAYESHGAKIGFAIGNGEEYPDGEGDALEAESIYATLEREIVPLFFRRGADRLPHDWITKMKGAIAHCVPEFNTHRMVRDYTQDHYVPSLVRSELMAHDGLALAKSAATWKQGIAERFAKTAISEVELLGSANITFGEEIHVRAKVQIGNATQPGAPLRSTLAAWGCSP